ncbi:MAG TPA: hypothetical protein VKQ30_23255 [Ktedonobacterales bacterium]|nr:hypothetical protein [Ktedonobacterales bacterium]
MTTYIDPSDDLPPRELAKELLRHDSARSMITDPSVPLNDVVKAIRRGGGLAGAAYRGGDAYC